MRFDQSSRVGVGVGFGLLLVLSLPASLLADDGRVFAMTIDLRQETKLTQVDATGPTHVESLLTVETESFYADPELGQEIEAAGMISLPPGATGTITKDDFTTSEDRTKASFRYESAVDDFSTRFPLGSHTITFDSTYDDCTFDYDFERAEFLGGGTLRPKVLNQTWIDGKLHLPTESLVIRWEAMGAGRFYQGDTESVSLVRVEDAQTGERVFRGYTEANSEFIRVGEHQGIDLSDNPDLVAGGTYNVHLVRNQTTVIVDADIEVEIRLSSTVSFQLFVDPEAPVPALPHLNVDTDDGAGTLSIRWVPSPDVGYYIFSTSGLGRLAYDPTKPLAFLTMPEDGSSEAVFTEPMTGVREFYRVFPVPK